MSSIKRNVPKVFEPQIIGQSMDFARSFAARAPNLFRELPLFEPAIEQTAPPRSPSP